MNTMIILKPKDRKRHPTKPSMCSWSLQHASLVRLFLFFFPYGHVCRFNQILDKNYKILACIRKTMPKNIEIPASRRISLPSASVFSTFPLVTTATILPGVLPPYPTFPVLRSAPLPKTSIYESRILSKRICLYTVISFASFKHGMPVIAPHPF